MGKTEIMAPAGDWASFNAAIQGGADSIYFGVEQLNMRARATNNFTLEDLPKLAELAGLHGVKTYLTLNTILYDHDLPLMRRVIDEVKKSGITAIIAADQAAISYASSQGVEVHISTQVNISNIEMVRFYAHFADVVVLARELSLRQMKHIADTIQKEQIKGPKGELIQIEVFAHGALCMAVSGKCYLSLHAYNSSANRGACRQNCRHGYKVESTEDGTTLEIDNEYIMSPKDLCTLNFLDELLATGVTVLKLEGRGRSPEYVKTVTKCYKEAAQAVSDGTYSEERVKEWMSQLDSVYNRGFWDGYYLGRKLGEWSSVYGSAATRQKIFVGKVLHYYPKAGVAHVRIKTKSIKVGDQLLIIGDTTGVVEHTVDSIYVDDVPAGGATQGQECTITVGERVREGDNLYVWEVRVQESGQGARTQMPQSAGSQAQDEGAQTSQTSGDQSAVAKSTESPQRASSHFSQTSGIA
ncbi:MAG: U32 family peptidase [Balneolales bacterium]|nr:U32 family peptidase [Balneolales bacterium]